MHLWGLMFPKPSHSVISKKLWRAVKIDQMLLLSFQSIVSKSLIMSISSI